MSLWSDIQRRSEGSAMRNEDEAVIYGGESGDLKGGIYEDMKYMIGTTGSYPYVFIETKLEISVFSGSGIVVLENIDGKTYNLERFTEGNKVTFKYGFNQDDDYVAGVREDGKKHSLNEIESLAKKFIDCINDAEAKFIKRDND